MTSPRQAGRVDGAAKHESESAPPDGPTRRRHFASDLHVWWIWKPASWTEFKLSSAANKAKDATPPPVPRDGVEDRTQPATRNLQQFPTLRYLRYLSRMLGAAAGPRREWGGLSRSGLFNRPFGFGLQQHCYRLVRLLQLSVTFVTSCSIGLSVFLKTASCASARTTSPPCSPASAARPPDTKTPTSTRASAQSSSRTSSRSPPAAGSGPSAPSGS